MRGQFWAMYPPDVDTLIDISTRGMVVPDASAMLHSYRLPSSVADAWLQSLEQLKDRVWVPHQAAHEYQRNRISVASKQEGLPASLESSVTKALKALREDLDKRKSDIERSAVVDVERLSDCIDSAQAQIMDHLAEARNAAVDKGSVVRGEDDVDRRLCAIVEGRMGPPPDEKKWEEVAGEGKKRFASEVPPGYADAKEKSQEHQKYGDLMIWKELMEEGAKRGVPAVFITEDVKPDWWRQTAGINLGPLPALREEYHSAVGEHIWLYQVSEFLSVLPQFGLNEVDVSLVNMAGQFGGVEQQADTDEGTKTADRRIRLIIRAMDELGVSEDESEDRLRQVSAVLGALLEQELEDRDSTRKVISSEEL